MLSLLCLMPALAQAHGPSDPVASAYLAQVSQVPAGLQVRVVDGDQGMWLRTRPGMAVVVLDPRGVAYLRFLPSGVWVNQSSELFYANLTPSEPPPPGLGPRTPPDWVRGSRGRSYQWHEGRLHALASVALVPGARYVGSWRVPLLVDGRPAAVSGILLHAGSPSLVWWWPLVVLLACVLAAWRVRSARLDVLLGRGAMAAMVVGIAVAAVARDLHGRPFVSPLQFVVLAGWLALAGWGAFRALRRRSDVVGLFLLGAPAVYQGLELAPTLTKGFVLLAVPPLLARVAGILCLAGGATALLMAFRLGTDPPSPRVDAATSREDDAVAPVG